MGYFRPRTPRHSPLTTRQECVVTQTSRYGHVDGAEEHAEATKETEANTDPVPVVARSRIRLEMLSSMTGSL